MRRRVVEELTAGRKQTHWIWFIFPQLARLGHSAMAERYAIRDLEQAKRYLTDPTWKPPAPRRTLDAAPHRQIRPADPWPSRRPKISVLYDALCSRGLERRRPVIIHASVGSVLRGQARSAHRAAARPLAPSAQSFGRLA